MLLTGISMIRKSLFDRSWQTASKPAPGTAAHACPMHHRRPATACCIAGFVTAIFATTTVFAPLPSQAAILASDSAAPSAQTDRQQTLAGGMLPLAKPDSALALPAAPAGMMLPELRPPLSSIFPPTMLRLEAFITEKTGIAPQAAVNTVRLKPGEGLAPALRRAGFSGRDAHLAVSKFADSRSLRKLPIGFQLETLAPGTLSPGAFRAALDETQDITLYQDAAGNWQRFISIRPIETFMTHAKGVIETSLYAASSEAGISDAIFNDVVQLLAFNVDFQREIRTGDSFEVLFERRRDLLSGKIMPSATLHMVAITLSGQQMQFFRHVQRDGTIGFYDRQGHSAARTLMRTPINGARLSSGFGNRKHPVLGYSAMHKGVDFAAPTGTPIMAAGSGVVEVAGWNGSYGRYIRIRHNGSYKTAYAHLSSISRGISPGQRVQQGQIIGRVGSTGRSTGPHLHYEIIRHGRKLNPMTVRLPTGKSLPEAERKHFRTTLAMIDQAIDGSGVLQAQR